MEHKTRAAGVATIIELCEVQSLAENLFGPERAATVCDTVTAERGETLAATLRECSANVELADSSAICGAYFSLNYRNISRALFSLDAAAKRKQGRSAATSQARVLVEASLTALAEATAPNGEVKSFAHVAHATLSFEAGEYGEALLSLAKFFATQQNLALPDKVTSFLPLFVDLAEAKDAEEIESTLKAATSPVGAWRMKTRVDVVSVGMLVGAEAGYEATLEGGELVSNASHVGVLAPLGLEYSFATKKKRTSFGLFLPIINVGRLIDVNPNRQILEEEGEQVSVSDDDLSFRQVLSPGLLGRVGLGRSPFAFVFGGYWAPGESLVRRATENGSSASALRFVAGFGVDLTLFPFSVHRKSKAERQQKGGQNGS